MPALRDALSAAGHENVRTYVQSGNIVLDSDLRSDALGEQVTNLIAAQFDLRIPVVTRTQSDLARVVAANPFADHVTDPRRYQVSFLSGPLDAATIERLHGRAAPSEKLVVIDRELFTWHPEGIARSKLATALAGKLGVVATARNWTTVTALLGLAREQT